MSPLECGSAVWGHVANPKGGLLRMKRLSCGQTPDT